VIVVDTNILVYFLVPGDVTPDAESAYQQDSAWAAPLLWRSEFRNVLASYLRRGMLTLEQALTTVEKAEALMQSRTYNVESRPVLELAHSSGCSAYDCEFVALAQELGVPLVTSDRKLTAKFKPTAISLQKYLRSARP
jgi:predicted nucleic acid-binding protein